MRVVFDGAPLGDGPITGVARAFLNALEAYGPCTVLLPDGAPMPPLRGVEVVPAPRGWLARQRMLPRLLRQLRADVLHSPVAAVPLRAPCPTIATVHDLPWMHAESGERTSWRRRLATRLSLRSAAAVLAPSRFTLEAAQRLVGPRHGARLRLVPHGVNAPAEPPLAAHERDGPLLVLGDDRPRKNRARVREAHGRALERRPDLPPLRLAGPPDDWVDEREKHALLRRCRALVSCSRFEGFGLPVLEGLAHGAPVVCSDLPPHREIAGGAALFADPENAGSIARAMVEAHADHALRERLARQGPERAAAFSVEACAAAWRALHEELAP